MCSVKIRHKDKVARCRFFVVPGDGPALLGMPDIKLLSILMIMFNVTEDQQTSRKFDSPENRTIQDPELESKHKIESR